MGLFFEDNTIMCCLHISEQLWIALSTLITHLRKLLDGEAVVMLGLGV